MKGRYCYNVQILTPDPPARPPFLPPSLPYPTLRAYLLTHLLLSRTHQADLMDKDSVVWVIDPLRFSNEFAGACKCKCVRERRTEHSRTLKKVMSRKRMTHFSCSDRHCCRTCRHLSRHIVSSSPQSAARPRRWRPTYYITYLYTSDDVLHIARRPCLSSFKRSMLQ